MTYHTLIVGVIALSLLANSSQAAVITLFDYFYNIDGTISDILTAGDPVPTEADDSGFDSITGLGTIIVTITGAGPHYTGLFLDHEIDEADNTFFNEFGASTGALAAGQSWEIDEPGFVFGDIVTNFTNSSLDNSNGVPAGSEDDVSMALGWDFALAVGETAEVRYRVAETAPPGGFFLLSQTDPDFPSNDATIYFSSTLNIRSDGPGGDIPEPTALATWGLLLVVGGTGYVVRRRFPG